MAFVDSIRKSFSRHRRRDVAEAGAASDGDGGEGPRSGGESITCVVTMLDESEASFEIEKSSTVSDLLGDVSNLLSLQEMDYFGFSYVDNEGLKCWLHDYKSIAKQMPGHPPYRFTFGVKFYVTSPSQLREDVTRYQFCLQLRSDLYKGRVVCDSEELAELAALSLQSELGDFDDSMHVGGYERNYEFVPNQEGLNIYGKIVELHKEQDGLLPFEAELRVLNIMQGLKGYGVRAFVCADGRGQSLRVDISHEGLVINQAETSQPKHPWRTVMKISHRRKKLTCKFQPEGGRPTTVALHFPSKRAAKEAWKSILEHHDFFSMELPAPKPKFISSVLRGSTFRYSGRTQYQIKRMEDFQIRPNQNINRKGSVRRKPPQRSASSASSRRTEITAITVTRSHSLSGATKISSNGIKIPLDSRNDHSLDSSIQDISLADQDKASMLVHLGTPAPSNANISNTLYTTVPGGDDDLEPDYQELNNATLKSRTAPALEAEGASLDVSDPPSPSPGTGSGRRSASPTARDPTTGEPMYNEIPSEAAPPPAPVPAPEPAREPANKIYEEPNYEEVPEARKPEPVEIVVTLSSPMGETKSLHSTCSGSAQATSSHSLDKLSDKEASVPEKEADGEAEIKPDHVYSMPKPRCSRGGSEGDDDGSLGARQDLSESQSNLISPDVMELMAELGIVGDEEKDDDDEEDEGVGKDDGNHGDGGDAAAAEPEDFDVDPFSTPGTTQYMVGKECVSPISASALVE